LPFSAGLCVAVADRPALGEVAEIEHLLSSLCIAAPEQFARVCAAYALLRAVAGGRGRVVKLRASLAEGFEDEAAYVVKRAVEALGSRVVPRHKARAVLAKIMYEELLRALGEG